jgi:iron complex transport system substrate-binding protein
VFTSLPLPHRRALVTVIASALLLLACGDDDTADAAPTDTAMLSSSAQPPDDGTDADSHTDEADAGGTAVSVTDFFGVEVVVPADPERIIAADDTALGNLLALGVRPVATSVNERSVPEFLGAELDGIEDIGNDSELGLNVERMLALDPELVVALGAEWAQERCDQLRQAMTTFCYEYGYATMDQVRRNLTHVAEALGLEDRGTDVVDELVARVADLAARIEAAGLSDDPVSIVRVLPDGYSVRFGTVPSALMRDLGISRPANQQDHEEFAFDLSLENVDQIDGYGIFAYVDTDAGESMRALEENPLWAQLDAVQSGNVWVVDSGVWNGISVPAAHAILDDIEATFVASAP